VARASSLETVDVVFGALAHEARRHIVVLLAHAGELSSGYLAAKFQHSWPTTTRHLAVLEDAGIVSVRREGRGSHYRLDRDRVRGVLEGWLRHLVPVDPEQTWAPTGARTTRELARRTKKKGNHGDSKDLSRHARSLQPR
jgi:DNA-binding transcriptional ArsR family regulator